MKTITTFRYIAVILFITITATSMSAQQIAQDPDPSFFHDLAYYAPEYTKNKMIMDLSFENHFAVPQYGLSSQFEVRIIPENTHEGFFSKVFHIFRKKNKAAAEEDTFHTTLTDSAPEDAILFNDSLN